MSSSSFQLLVQMSRDDFNRSVRKIVRLWAWPGRENDVTDLIFNPYQEHMVGRLWHRVSPRATVWTRFKVWFWSQ